jgi:hypothetical protein
VNWDAVHDEEMNLIDLDAPGDVLPLMILTGVGPLCLYVIIWLGCVKSWYILVPLPGRLGSALVYALVPVGFFFVVLGLSVASPASDPRNWDIWDIPFFGLIGMTLLFLIWVPQWLKPPWVRWLEREYGYGLNILLEEARAMGRWKWEVRVRTRDGLESWVQEVLEKRAKDMYWAWLDWVDYYVARNTTRMKRRCPEKLGTLEQFMIPPHVYRPLHREKDYDYYLEVKRAGILHSAIKAFDQGRSFVAADLERICPGVSRGTIRRVLSEARDRGRIECTGRGRSARWRRV